MNIKTILYLFICTLTACSSHQSENTDYDKEYYDKIMLYGFKPGYDVKTDTMKYVLDWNCFEGNDIGPRKYFDHCEKNLNANIKKIRAEIIALEHRCTKYNDLNACYNFGKILNDYSTVLIGHFAKTPDGKIIAEIMPFPQKYVYDKINFLNLPYNEIKLSAHDKAKDFENKARQLFERSCNTYAFDKCYRGCLKAYSVNLYNTGNKKNAPYYLERIEFFVDQPTTVIKNLSTVDKRAIADAYYELALLNHPKPDKYVNAGLWSTNSSAGNIYDITTPNKENFKKYLTKYCNFVKKYKIENEYDITKCKAGMKLF